MTHEEGASTFAVILERESPKPDAEIGRLLAYHLDLHPTDAIVRVRYGGGLIVDGVTEEVADHLVLRLRDIGVRGRKIETGVWALMPRGCRAFGLELGEDTLRVRLVGGRTREIPRADIFAVHVYGLLAPREKPEDDAKKTAGPSGGLDTLGDFGSTLAARTVAAADEPDRARARPRDAGELSPRGQTLHRNLAEAGAAAMEFHLTMLCATQGPVRVRKNDFDFGCLGEQRQQHSLDNFLLFLEEALTYLPAAWNRKGAEQLLADLDPKKILYFKEEEAWNLERWLYQWARIEAEEKLAGKEDA